MENNTYYLSKLVDERIETSLKEVEAYRLAKIATQDSPTRHSLRHIGRSILIAIASAFSSWHSVST
jgi:hypothetical protein